MRSVFEVACYPDFGPIYPFSYSKDREGRPVEGATVRFAWSEKGLYAFAELEDSNLIQHCRSDEHIHYRTGDVLELLVQPLGGSHKWEMYATPFGNKSTLFFPDLPTRLSPEEALTKHAFRDLEVSVEITSKGWNARMFVPKSQLSALGAEWGAGAQWIAFCGRYNYNNEDLVDPELSMVPAVSTSNYHLVDEYALLRFDKSNS